MAIYTYECKSCGTKTKENFSVEDRPEKIKCWCGEEAEYQLPSTATTLTYESRDKYHGKQTKKGVQAQLKERMDEHHDNYELAEKIDKHGLNDAVRNKWTKKIKKV